MAATNCNCCSPTSANIRQCRSLRISTYADFRYEENSLYRRLSLACFKWLLFFSSMDPFYVYKMPDSQYRCSRYKVFSARQLRMQTNECCRRSETLSYMIYVWFNYFLIKSGLLAVLHYINHRTGLSINRVRQHPTLDRLLAGVGDPLSATDELAMYVYLAMPLAIYNGFVFMCRFRHDHFMDIPCIRFMLRPQQELQRLDAFIWSRLDCYHASVSLMKANLVKERLTSSAPIRSKRSLLSRLASLDQLKSQILSQKSQCQGLHSVVWSPSSYRKLYSNIAACTLPLVVLTNIWIVTAFLLFLHQAQLGRCQSTVAPDRCRPSEALTLPEQLYMIEALFCFLCCAQNFVVYSIMFALLVQTQWQHLYGIRADLNRCIEAFRSSVDLSSKAADRILFETFMRVLIPQDDVHRGTRTFTSLTTSLTLTGLCMLGASLIDETSTRPTKSNMLRYMVILAVWLLANTYALLCAQIASEAGNIQKLYWSVMAEVLLRGARRGLEGDFNLVIWRKLLYSIDLTRHKFTTAPLRVQLNYKRIIEMNFLVLSLASYLLIRQQTTTKSHFGQLF